MELTTFFEQVVLSKDGKKQERNLEDTCLQVHLWVWYRNHKLNASQRKPLLERGGLVVEKKRRMESEWECVWKRGRRDQLSTLSKPFTQHTNGILAVCCWLWHLQKTFFIEFTIYRQILPLGYSHAIGAYKSRVVRILLRYSRKR